MDNFCFLVSGFLKLCFLKACVNVRNQQTWLAGLLRIATVLSEKKVCCELCVFGSPAVSDGFAIETQIRAEQNPPAGTSCCYS